MAVYNNTQVQYLVTVGTDQTFVQPSTAVAIPLPRQGNIPVFSPITNFANGTFVGTMSVVYFRPEDGAPQGFPIQLDPFSSGTALLLFTIPTGNLFNIPTVGWALKPDQNTPSPTISFPFAPPFGTRQIAFPASQFTYYGPGGGSAGTVSLIGVQSGTNYGTVDIGAIIIPPTTHIVPGVTLNVNPQADQSYVLQEDAAHTSPWSAAIVPLQGIVNGGNSGNLVGFPSQANVNFQGIPYFIPSIPDTAANDHPPNEMRYARPAGVNGTAAIAAPGAGKRLRIFSVTMGSIDSSAVVTGSNLSESIGGTVFAIANGQNMVTTSYLPTGIPLPNNAAVTIVSTSGTNLTVALILFSVETI